MEDYSLDDVQSTLDLTFTSLWKCLQGEIKILKGQSRPGSIVNISSNSAIISKPLFLLAVATCCLNAYASRTEGGFIKGDNNSTFLTLIKGSFS